MSGTCFGGKNKILMQDENYLGKYAAVFQNNKLYNTNSFLWHPQNLGMRETVFTGICKNV
jgi:hypothetical protein